MKFIDNLIDLVMRTQDKLVLAKVKGENKWLTYNGSDFVITEDKAQATEFTKPYLKEIKTSKWGNHEWTEDKK